MPHKHSHDEKREPVRFSGRLSYVGARVGITLLLCLATYGAWYIWASRHSPRVVDIVGSSILITLLLGSCSALFWKAFEKPRKWKASVLMLFLVSLSLLVMLIAFLVFSSKEPTPTRIEIPVTYILNRRTLSIPDGLATPDSESSASYFEVCQLFRCFRDRTDRNRQMVADMAQLFGHENHSQNLRIFHDLTEYIVL
jgi:hypothetical protein